LVIFQPPLRSLVAQLVDQERAAGREIFLFEVPDAEEAKSFAVVEEAWRLLEAARFSRSDLIVAIGGGAACDVAGFVAATWLRGIRFINLPTTLLAMVDAAIGGKTGINTPGGKNLVGSFHTPHAVICDLDMLKTLPPVAVASGLAEIIKCGFVADPKILDIVWSAPREVLRPASAALRDLIERAVAVKADVVARDPFEQSLRAILNYGHTFGHAIERLENYRWPHGHAVAVGMVFAAEVSTRIGVMNPALRSVHREVLKSVGLPTTYIADRWESLEQVMRLDKKNRSARQRLVVLEEVGKPMVVENPDPKLLLSAYDALSAPEHMSQP
jgi:3-dehydroquinate synthase